MNDRAAGVLLHPTSLPGRYGIGYMGDELIAFLDWIQDAGLSIWQVLPLFYRPCQARRTPKRFHRDP